MKKALQLAVIIALFFFTACRPWVDRWGKDTKGYGYVPIYTDKNNLKQIAFLAAKPTTNAGKIYAYGDYIFQNDMGAGVHIINNTNKNNPAKTGFLAIPYNYEIAIKDSFLYANNLTDLIVIDIRDPFNPKLINRINSVFPNYSSKYPTETNVYFECADTTKGAVVGWKKQSVINQTCYR